MQPFFRFEVDLDALTDAMWGFVSDPRPTRNDLPVVEALSDIHPESIDVMEAMLLDGTDDRADVAAYVMTVFGGKEALSRQSPHPRRHSQRAGSSEPYR